ncbi:MAG: Sec-independent protein translocase protein TatB [Desulfovibrio sp.]|jgi:sec-independent protein translocase protein TatB|nr:Sec-independent protein translocase protein TatB [Desulfovibrio sp.]
MFGIGSTELVVILLVALIVLGPKSLAGIARTLGKAMGEFRRVSTDFQRTLNAEAAQEEEVERKKREAAESATAGKAEENESKTGTAVTSVAAEGVCAEHEGASPPDLPPAGSPLAEALNKAETEALAAENSAGKQTDSQHADKGDVP